MQPASSKNLPGLIDAVWPADSTQPAVQIRRAIALHLASSPDRQLGLFRVQLPNLGHYLRLNHAKLWLNPKHAWPKLKKLLLHRDSEGAFVCGLDDQRREVVELSAEALLRRNAARGDVLESAPAPPLAAAAAVATAAALAQLPAAPTAAASPLSEPLRPPPPAVIRTPAEDPPSGPLAAEVRHLQLLVHAALRPDPTASETRLRLQRAAGCWLASSPQLKLGPRSALLSTVGHYLRVEHPQLWLRPTSEPGVGTLKELLRDPAARGIFQVAIPAGGKAEVVTLDVTALEHAAAAAAAARPVGQCTASGPPAAAPMEAPEDDARDLQCLVDRALAPGPGVSEQLLRLLHATACWLATTPHPIIGQRSTLIVCVGGYLKKHHSETWFDPTFQRPSVGKLLRDPAARGIFRVAVPAGKKTEVVTLDVTALQHAAAAAMPPPAPPPAPPQSSSAVACPDPAGLAEPTSGCAPSRVGSESGSGPSAECADAPEAIIVAAPVAAAVAAAWPGADLESRLRRRAALLLAVAGAPAEGANGVEGNPYSMQMGLMGHLLKTEEPEAFASWRRSRPARQSTLLTLLDEQSQAAVEAGGGSGAGRRPYLSVVQGHPSRIVQLDMQALLAGLRCTAVPKQKREVGDGGAMQIAGSGVALSTAAAVPPPASSSSSASVSSSVRASVSADQAKQATEAAPEAVAEAAGVDAPTTAELHGVRTATGNKPPPAAVLSAAAVVWVSSAPPRRTAATPPPPPPRPPDAPQGAAAGAPLPVAAAVAAAWPGADLESRLRRRAALLLAAAASDGPGCSPSMPMTRMGSLLRASEPDAIKQWRASRTAAQRKLQVLLDEGRGTAAGGAEAAMGGGPERRRPYLCVVPAKPTAYIRLDMAALLEDTKAACRTTALQQQHRHSGNADGEASGGGYGRSALYVGGSGNGSDADVGAPGLNGDGDADGGFQASSGGGGGGGDTDGGRQVVSSDDGSDADLSGGGGDGSSPSVAVASVSSMSPAVTPAAEQAPPPSAANAAAAASDDTASAATEGSAAVLRVGEAAGPAEGNRGDAAGGGSGGGALQATAAVAAAVEVAIPRAWPPGLNMESRVRRFAAAVLAELSDGPRGAWSMLWAQMTARIHAEIPSAVRELVAESPQGSKLTKKTALRNTLDESASKRVFLRVVQHTSDLVVQLDVPALLSWQLMRQLDKLFGARGLRAAAAAGTAKTAAAKAVETAAANAATKLCVARLLAAAPPPHELAFAALGGLVPKMLPAAVRGSASGNLRSLCLQHPDVFRVMLQGKSHYVVRLVSQELLDLVAALAEAKAIAARKQDAVVDAARTPEGAPAAGPAAACQPLPQPSPSDTAKENTKATAAASKATRAAAAEAAAAEAEAAAAEAEELMHSFVQAAAGAEAEAAKTAEVEASERLAEAKLPQLGVQELEHGGDAGPAGGPAPEATPSLALPPPLPPKSPVTVPIPIPVPIPVTVPVPGTVEEEEGVLTTPLPYTTFDEAPAAATGAAPQELHVIQLEQPASDDLGWLLAFEHPRGEQCTWAPPAFSYPAAQFVVDPYSDEAVAMLDHCRACSQVGVVVQSYGGQLVLVALYGPATPSWPAAVYLADVTACTALCDSEGWLGQQLTAVLLAGLRELLEAPSVTKVVHGCEQLRCLEAACGGAVTAPLVDTRVLLCGMAFMLGLPTAPPPPPPPAPAPLASPPADDPAAPAAATSAEDFKQQQQQRQVYDARPSCSLNTWEELRAELATLHDHVDQLYNTLKGMGLWADRPRMLEALAQRHFDGLRRERLSEAVVAAAAAQAREGRTVAAAAQAAEALWLARPLGPAQVAAAAGCATALPDVWLAMVEEAVLWVAVHSPMRRMERLRGDAAAAAAEGPPCSRSAPVHPCPSLSTPVHPGRRAIQFGTW